VGISGAAYSKRNSLVKRVFFIFLLQFIISQLFGMSGICIPGAVLFVDKNRFTDIKYFKRVVSKKIHGGVLWTEN
jgi:hypothetical protein